MNRLANWMIRLYPKPWRARYGDELETLLADAGADARVVGDLFRGGMRMQFKTWSFLKLAVVLGAAGILLGTGISLLMPNVYISKATMQLTPRTIGESMIQGGIAVNLSEQIQEMETEILSRTSLRAIINDPQILLYKHDLKVTPLEDVIEEMKRNIRIQFAALPGTLGKRAAAFDISFSYPDPNKAQLTVQALMNAFAATNMRRNRELPSASNTGSIIVLDAPSLPVSPIYPRPQLLEAFGFIAGVLLVWTWRKFRGVGFLTWRVSIAAVALGFVGYIAVIAAGDLDLLPYRYRSTATLGLPMAADAGQIQALEAAVFSRTSLSTVINDPHLLLYKNELRTEPLEDVIQEMKRHLTVIPIHFSDSELFAVSFDYPDRYKAQLTVQRIINEFFKADQRLYPSAGSPEPFTPIVMDILDTASLPLRPVKPNRYMIALTRGIFGVAIAAIVAMIRRRWKPNTDFPVNVLNQ